MVIICILLFSDLDKWFYPITMVNITLNTQSQFYFLIDFRRLLKSPLIRVPWIHSDVRFSEYQNQNLCHTFLFTSLCGDLSNQHHCQTLKLFSFFFNKLNWEFKGSWEIKSIFTLKFCFFLNIFLFAFRRFC